MKLRRNLAKMAAVSTGMALLLAPVTATAQAGQKITKESFGLHSFVQGPQVPQGSLRMNMWPSWNQIQPTSGSSFNWAIFDQVVATAESWGYTDLLYVFGVTPTWASSPVKDPSKEIQGQPVDFPKNYSSAPKNMSDFRNYATAVVKRYKGRIDSYQVWNEITTPQFYQGTAKQMAKMTTILNKAVNQHDPSAKVISGSVQTHDYRLPDYERMAKPYFKELKKANWPVDVVAGHFYPDGKSGPDQRIKQIEMFKADVNRAGRPNRVKLWDTEANFWTRVPGTPSKGRLRGAKAATYVARNYLDTWRTGLDRSYWYMWTQGSQDLGFPGIQMRSDTPWSKVAYTRMYDWTVGSKFTGCATKGNLVTCTFKKGGKFQIAFTSKGTATAKVAGTKPVTPVYGGGTVTAKGSTKVGTMPVRIG